MKERRRGADLEEALLEAAWAELTQRGYAGLTVEGVAARAGTSRPVLARRWDSKAKLAVAAIRQQMSKYPSDVVDRGDVRAELLEYLERLSDRATGVAAAFLLFASEYFQESSTTPQELRAALSAGLTDNIKVIFERAIARGEIDKDKLLPPIATLLNDLFRHHAIMTFSPPSRALRMTWVDSIFLPLVRPAGRR